MKEWGKGEVWELIKDYTRAERHRMTQVNKTYFTGLLSS